MRKNKNRGYQSEAHPPVNIVHFASKSVGAGEKTRIGHKRAGGKGK